jgi:hypothetical protein
MRSQTFEASTTIQQQRTILTGVTHISITAINTAQETIGFFRSSESTEIRQGCAIAKKVDGKILSVTMKFVTGIRQERIPDFVFVRPVRDVTLCYHPGDPGCLES